MTQLSRFKLETQKKCVVLALLALLPHALMAQMNIPNPLIKPVKAGRPVAEGAGQAGAEPQGKATPPPLPEGRSTPDQTTDKVAADKPVSPQESFTLQQQVLNSEKIPTPLRITLSTLSVTAIVGDLAVLRQQLNVSNLAALGGAAAQINTGSAGGISPVVGGGFNQPAPQPAPQPVVQPGQLGGATAAPAIKPFSVRVKHKKPTYISGHEVTPIVADGVVSLYWKTPQGDDLIVYNGNVETASAGAYVPPPVLLERRDYPSYERLIPNVTGSTSGTSSSSSGAAGAAGTTGTAATTGGVR
jgi:hypothetical protein